MTCDRRLLHSVFRIPYSEFITPYDGIQNSRIRELAAALVVGQVARGGDVFDAPVLAPWPRAVEDHSGVDLAVSGLAECVDRHCPVRRPLGEASSAQ